MSCSQAQACVSCSSFFDDMICGWQIDLVGVRDGGREGEEQSDQRGNGREEAKRGEGKREREKERFFLFDWMDLTLTRRDALYDTSETDSHFLFFYQRKCYGGRSACTLAHTELRNLLLSLSVLCTLCSLEPPSFLSVPTPSPFSFPHLLQFTTVEVTVVGGHRENCVTKFEVIIK